MGYVACKLTFLQDVKNDSIVFCDSFFYNMIQEVRILREINLGRVLIENRHKRGITQDELAAYMGVSKAAVSKWETGVSHS